MTLVVDTVSVLGTHGFLLPTTSFEAEPGEVTVVAADPGHASAALALALAGRALLLTGHVSLDGDESTETLRRQVTLVDVPDVSEPVDALTVRHVLADELALAGAPSRRADVTAFLADLDLGRRSDDRFGKLTPGERTGVLLASARRRADAKVVVLDHPDRRGGDPSAWWPHLIAAAESGLVVVALVTHAAVQQLGVHTRYEIGVRA